jgi:UPF0755 protein
MRRLGLLIAVLGALALILGAVLFLQSWRGAGPLTTAMTVTVPAGASLRSVAGRLEADGAIASSSSFLLGARILGGSGTIKAGEYRIPAQASAARVLAILQSGKTVPLLIAIPEGMPSVLVRERLMANTDLTGEVETPVEGSVLPDSYGYERGEKRAAVLARMQAAMTAFLDKAWAERAAGIVVQTQQQAITLASIVEKETARAEERTTVASVYQNRLRTGMPLQADPTVIYPITLGKPLGRRIRQSELRARNGYNTYAKPGLPKGPIANPGRAAIEAVLHPAETRALYFVADGTGGHVFADSYAEHQANVRKWYAIRRERGEM